MNKDLNDVSHRLVFSLLGGGYTLRKKSILVFVLILHYHQVNTSKFCPTFYSQDLLSFDSLSRDWILKLDPNDNFRNEIINLDYPWVHGVILVCMSSL